MEASNKRLDIALYDLILSLIVCVILVALSYATNSFDYILSFIMLFIGVVVLYVGLGLTFGNLSAAIAMRKNVSGIAPSYFIALSLLLTPISALLFAGFLPDERTNIIYDNNYQAKEPKTRTVESNCVGITRNDNCQASKDVKYLASDSVTNAPRSKNNPIKVLALCIVGLIGCAGIGMVVLFVIYLFSGNL